MNLGILYWFYKDVPVCRNHLRFYRRLNPGVPIYGLYSGDPAHASTFESALGTDLDDFYVFDAPRSDYWRWANGDLVIADWYRKRGHSLAWDSLFLAPWDLIATAPVREIFASLSPGHLMVSNLRPAAEVADWWMWMSRHREDYSEFMAGMNLRFGPSVTAWCCQFIVVCLPRNFLEAYAAMPPPGTGFIEYRLPTCAATLGIPFSHDHRFDAAWPGEPDSARHPNPTKLLNPGIREVPLRSMLRESMRSGGQRIFHPVERTLPLGPLSACSWLVDTITGRRGRRPHREQPRPHLANRPHP
jgi:hypothetical protein